MTDAIRITHAEHVTTVTLNRPDKRNAITQPMYAAMAEALNTHATSDDSRVLVITGTGEAFTAGNDLHDFSKGDGSDNPPVLQFLHAIQDCPKPVIAAVNGMAIGVGLTMLLHCDLVIASEAASFSAPFASLALVPEAASSMLLPQTVGLAVASDILMTSRVLTAEEAHFYGLASRVLPAEGFEAETACIAKTMAEMSPTALRRAKALIRSQHADVRERMMLETKAFAEQLNSVDFAESVMAKLQKRKPVYS